MRITLAVAIAAALFALPAAAQDKQTAEAIKGTGRYGAAGCGLGSMAFGDQPGAVQIFAATTNSLFGTQTFGITTGTSNCGPGLFASGTKNLVEANREALAKDVARGQGEVIGALTVINACQDSVAVGAALQRDFQVIFPTEQASSDEVTAAILKTLHSDPSLGCAKG
jgi:opacity protein-like surface antigen